MFVRRLAILSALATTVAFSCLAQSNPVEKTPRVVKYHTTIDVVKYVYGPAPPVEHLRSGRYSRNEHARLLSATPSKSPATR